MVLDSVTHLLGSGALSTVADDMAHSRNQSLKELKQLRRIPCFLKYLNFTKLLKFFEVL